MSRAQAEQVLVDAGFTIGDVTTEYSDSVTKGDVISQDPAAGTRLAKGSAIALVASKGAKPETTKTVVVGAILPLDGLWSSVGQSANSALSLALAPINHYLESDNIKIEPVVFNSKGDPEAALAAMEDLNALGVKMVVGPLSSSEAEAVVGYAGANGMILVSPSCTAISLALDDNLYRLIPNDANQAQALALLMEHQSITHVLPVYLNDVYGDDLVVAFIANTELSSSAVTALDGVSYDSNTVDFAQLAATMETALSGYNAASTAILFIGENSDAISLFNAAGVDGGLSKFKWYASEEVIRDPALLQDATSAAFARKVALEGFTVACRESIAVTPSMFASSLMTSTLGTLPAPTSLPIWDAVWAIAETYRLNSDADAATLKANFETVMNMTRNVFGQLNLLDDNGDMSVVTYSRFAVEEKDNGDAAWDFAGVFIQHITNGAYITDVSSKYTQESGVATIGAVMPLSGKNEENGFGALYAIDLALEHANTYFSLAEGLDIRFTVDIRDSQSDPETALAQVKALHEQGINLVIGPIVSSELEAVQEYVAANDMVLISTTSTALSLAEEDQIMRLTANDTHQAKAISRLLTEKGKDNVVLLYIDDMYGVDFVTAFASAFTGVLNTIPYDADATDFSKVLATAEGYVSNAGDAGKVAVLLVSINEGVQLLEQVPDGPLTSVSWYGADGLCQSRALLTSDKAVAVAKKTSLTCSTYDVAGMRQFSPMRNTAGEYLASLLGGTAAWNEISAYDALWLAAYAVATTSISADSATLWSKLDNPNGAIGIGGTYTFDANGDQSLSTYAFYTVEDAASGAAWDVTALYRDLKYHPDDLYIVGK
jgi:branched-chain amino acid transport system substrate-binding protein